MLLGLSLFLVLGKVYAETFTNPVNSTINNFHFSNNHVYAATPEATYMLSTSLSIVDQFAKSLSSSLLLYIDSDILLECGERKQPGDSCCFLTDSTAFSTYSNSSDDLCKHFKDTRGFYPVKYKEREIFLLNSYYVNEYSGKFSRMYFYNLSEWSLDHKEERIDIPITFKSIAVSPEMGMFQKFLVIKQSSTNMEAYYFDPDLDAGKNYFATLECDSSITDVVFGFGLKADSTVTIENLGLDSDMTHFVMYKNTDLSYRICSFAENSEMRFLSNKKLADLSKDPLLTITPKHTITAFNGLVVNGGITGFYSVGNQVYKIVMKNGDTSFRPVSVIYEADSDITNIRFFSNDIGYISTRNSIENFPLHRCETYGDCGACTVVQDPHCGWCTFQNKCSTKSDCIVGPEVWTQESTQCLKITVTSDQKDVIAGQQLLLQASNLVLPTDKVFTCVFQSTQGEKRQSNATYNNGQLSCLVPQFTKIYTGLLELNAGVYYLSAELGAVKVKYHQCDLYDKCGDCSSISKFCTWCPLEASCARNQDANCNLDKVDDPGNCPLIRQITPARIPRKTIIGEVVVMVDNLPNYQVSSVYQCEITSRQNSSHSQTFDIKSHSTNDTIFCADVQIDEAFPEYRDSETELDVSIVYRGGATTPNGVAVVVGRFSVYACELLASDCVQCVSKYSNDYSCRFCNDTCAYASAQVCEEVEVIQGNPNDCLAKNTRVEQTVPDWSPGEGGVPITLTGKSLAVQDQHVTVQFIFQTGQIIDCINSTIVSSTRLECVTPSIMNVFGLKQMYNEMNSTLAISYDGSTIPKHKSKKDFYFTPMDIASILPGIGPESGGTRISVKGTRLCVPFHTTVTLNNYECINPICNMTDQTLECDTPPAHGAWWNQTVSVHLGQASVSDRRFEYSADPVVEKVDPNCTLKEGGIDLTVTGYHFDVIQKPLLVIGAPGDDLCSIKGGSAPTNKTYSQLIYKLPPSFKKAYVFALKMDGVSELCETQWSMSVLDEPTPLYVNETEECIIGIPCYINITMTQIYRLRDHVTLTIGEIPCANQTITKRLIGGRLACVAPSFDQIKGSVSGRKKRAILGNSAVQLFPLTIHIGDFSLDIGAVKYAEKGFDILYIYIIAGGFVGLVLLVILIMIIKNRKDRDNITKLEKKHQHEIDKVEATYAKAARQEFTELTLMGPDQDVQHINPDDIPYRIFSDYLVHIMFPNVDKRKIVHSLQLEQCSEFPDHKLVEFRKFLNNDVFLLSFIDVIERQRDFQVAHRCEVASYMTIALYSDFNYLSHILFQLLNRLIANDVPKVPKLLLRATKSVAEKLLTNWLSLSLYDYLSTCTGPSLYELCSKITTTVEQGPLDFVTHHARYALSQDKILSEEVEYKPLHVEAEGPDGARSSVTLLDCDTISQAKGKIYRAIYSHQPYSQQPALDSISLLWTPGQAGSGSMELCDFDDRMAEAYSEKKFNTLLTYKVQTGDLLRLTMFSEYHQAPMSTIRSVKRQTVSEICRYHLVKNFNGEIDFRSPAPKRSTTVCAPKIASEAFLPTLIRTKEHLSKAFDSMMGSVFMESNNIPPAIKYLFDYLDKKTELLSESDRSDPEIAHIWKTNSLPLRFWINIIKNPQFLFDIEKPPIMDSYLSVIGQCFMDCFSVSTMTLNKDSSANRLVYNREVTVYRKVVDKWYRDIRQSPGVNLRTVVNESRLPPLPFRSTFAVAELLKYAYKYRAEIAASLPTQGAQFTRSDFEVLTKP